ncbi:MAG: hypothetical protein BWZ10_00733 [candidate division BRC1 bacterium ADurb.BinA364]|nr:MAG: hypothetical protein BWZ10_00733 [candidate division BRC1 bacterium ADurb.BinA364]
MPASILDPIKEYADTHAEPLSAIVSEALAAYLAREIRRECPRCGVENAEGSDYCKSCGEPLSREAESEAEKKRLESKKDLLVRLLGDPDLYAEFREAYLDVRDGEASRPIAEDQATLIPEPEQT